jgi:DNA-binding protein HU-beta
MNKAELVEALVKTMEEKHGKEVSKSDAQAFLESFTDIVSREMKNSDIVLTGFGKFSVSERAARTGRDPRNGKEIDIPSAYVPKFSPGKLLKEAVNQ